MNFNRQFRDRYVRASELIPPGTCRLLDFGCSTGKFLGYLQEKAICRELYGCDVNSEVIAKAQAYYHGIEFVCIRTSEIPFPDSYFAVVTMLDVLEHVPDEVNVLKQVARVLIKGGTLILSVPHKGPFAWCDVGNIKFRFPTLHRMFYQYILRDMETYTKKFRSGNGLFGDISISNNMWHKHYSDRELIQFLVPHFKLVKIEFFSLLTPIWTNLNYIYQLVFKHDNPLFRWLLNTDFEIEAGRLSYNVILKARKK